MPLFHCANRHFPARSGGRSLSQRTASRAAMSLLRIHVGGGGDGSDGDDETDRRLASARARYGGQVGALRRQRYHRQRSQPEIRRTVSSLFTKPKTVPLNKTNSHLTLYLCRYFAGHIYFPEIYRKMPKIFLRKLSNFWN